jgi:predicted O-methyltransferase YrrM
MLRVRYELPPCQDRQIWDIWLSMQQLPAMAVADELGVFHAIEEKPATAHETAQRLGLNRRASEVLFAMLAALGLTSVCDGRHELSDLSRTYLLPRSPYYWGPLLRSLGVAPKQRGDLLRALRAADDAAAAIPGVPSEAWQRGHIDRAQAELVSRIMHCHSLPAALAVARSPKLQGIARLMDVGGGSGCFSIAMAQHLPDIRCSVLELPAMCEITRGYIEQGGVSDRVDALPRDMFRQAWSEGYDCVFLSNVFHDWDAEANLVLARRAYEVLPPGGQILLHEMLLNDAGPGPLTTASFSMLMLVGTRGRQYSFGELQPILASAGFEEIAVHPSYGYYSLVSGRKP